MLDRVDFGWGAATAILAAAFGKYWILFAGLLAFNIVDYITGIIKARQLKRSSSEEGAKGITKKVSIWIVIALAFYTSYAFVMIGEIFGFDLKFVTGFGWLTLAMYLINEMRSILENLVEMGVDVPKFLIQGLDITAKLVAAKANETEGEQDHGKNKNQNSKPQ